jgi:hypothetical protein
MTTFVVIATGQSLTMEQVDLVHRNVLAGRCQAIAISNAYERAPWSAALISNDRNWWINHPKALKFAGRRFCAGRLSGVETLPFDLNFGSGVNSGLQGMRVARDVFKASRLLLLGFDMHGTHYFGRHPAPLQNTSVSRFAAHVAQFRKWKGCTVVNCTPGSALKQFPVSTLERELSCGEETNAA